MSINSFTLLGSWSESNLIQLPRDYPSQQRLEMSVLTHNRLEGETHATYGRKMMSFSKIKKVRVVGSRAAGTASHTIYS